MLTKNDFLSQYEDAANEVDPISKGMKVITKNVETVVSILESGESISGRVDIFKQRHGAFKCHIKWGRLDVIPAKKCDSREKAIKFYNDFLTLMDMGAWDEEIEATYDRFYLSQKGNNDNEEETETADGVSKYVYPRQ